MLAVLSGGTGTPKLLRGMKEVADFSVIVNTAEDVWVSGNKVCPDIDSVIYALAEVIDETKWWGIQHDTFMTHFRLKELGFDEVLMIGDADRATHIMRSELLRQGMSLTEATKKLAEAYGVEKEILPMCEEEVETRVVTDEGDMHFQEFWVRRRGEPEVTDVYFRGIENALPTEYVLHTLERARGVVIGPSNPITSIAPILSLRGIRELLEKKKVVAVSPIVGKSAVSGPAAKLMRAKGFDVSPKGVGEVYRDFLDVLVVDTSDDGDAHIKSENYEIVATDIIMKTKEDAIRLSEFLLQLF